MKYTSPLLKKFISINDTPENIAKNLILKTCEIEEIHGRNIADSIVIGYITSCEKHPDADKLSVCQVNCGKKGEYQIICWGSNVAAGLYVPVALPGTVFEKAGITIEPRKMRGLESNGMICSKEELGIMEDMEKHSIRDLKEDLDDISDTDLGIPLKEKYSRLESRVMEVDNKSLTNRPDLTGHFGAAIELNSIYWSVESQKSKVESQYISFNKVKEYMEQCNPKHIMEVLENSTKPEKLVQWESDDLNTYILLHLKNINVKQASFFTRLETLDIGGNPINNRVDFSNLFMNISGQPIHFFDAEKVDGDIIVRNAKDGEKFTDLFEAEHILEASDLVIADQKKILALAGVVGGLESWITEHTKNILVEIANFDPVAVRKTWTRLWLRTDAELRFEKNINPRYSLFCLILFLDELNYYKKDLGDFDIGGLSYYIRDEVKGTRWKEIEVNTKVMEQFIFGQKVKWFDKKVEEILTGLGFTWEGNSKFQILNSKFQIIPPLRRGPDDINIIEDIYEEVARIYGYDQIESLPLLSKTEHIPYNDYIAIQRKIEDILVRNIGCNQVETYPWLSEKIVKDLWISDKLYKLQNPVNPEAPYLRGDMFPELLSYVAKNCKFFDEFKIFDIGKVWNTFETKEKRNEELWLNIPEQLKNGNFASNFVVEKTALGVMIYRKHIDSWQKDTILTAKRIIKILIPWGTITFETTHFEKYHPRKQAIVLLNGKKIWFVWSIHPMVLNTYKIPETAWVSSIALDIDKILAYSISDSEKSFTYETLQDQIIRRDICFVVDANKSFDEVIAAVKNVPEVKEVEVFDVYAGENLGEDKKSVSIKIKIVGESTKDWASMTTEQINEVLNKAIKAGEKAWGQLRA